MHQGGHYWRSSGSLHRSSWFVGCCGRLYYRPTRSEQAKIYAFAIDASASVWAIGVRSIEAFPTNPNASLMPHFAQNSLTRRRAWLWHRTVQRVVGQTESGVHECACPAQLPSLQCPSMRWQGGECDHKNRWWGS
jgi:hypothetical protein